MIKFGTGGWRAIIGEEFIKRNICWLAKAMAEKMKAEKVADKGIVMGYDRRFLSKETVIWTCEVLAAEGIPCWFVNHSAPTPMIMHHVMKHGFPYGMMVTASHNPSIYNGIKVFTAGGRDADEFQTQDIEKYIAAVNPDAIQRMDYEEAKKQGLVHEFFPMDEYVDDIMSVIDVAAIKKAQLRIIFDPMFGVGEQALQTILITGRCYTKLIHQEHDTLFGRRMPAPAEDRLWELKNCVVEEAADLGIALDGDADRLGVVDDTGRYLSPNDILLLLYYYLLKYKGLKGSVVRNISTTHRLDRLAEKYGEVCHEVPVGFKYISGKMSETDALLGGESSGGLTVTGHINGKDGVYAASLLVEMVAVTGQKLSELMKEIDAECGTSWMEERSYKLSEKYNQELRTRIYEEKELPDLSKYEIERVSYMDGCKVYFKDGGWVSARFSGTEPLVRIFCEMTNRADAVAMCQCFENHFGILQE